MKVNTSDDRRVADRQAGAGARPEREGREVLDALVVGAGPAGIGVALALDVVEGILYGVVERGEIGQTFEQWPRRQTFLTPSFTGNGFGATDLNAVHPLTSPAFSLGTDYPNGPEYAKYLRGVAVHFGLPIVTGTEVSWVRREGDLFLVRTSGGEIPARSLVWAGGEFADRRFPDLKGKGEVVHSSDEAAWVPRAGHVVVIGGYESGVDIACHHVEQGAARVTVLDPGTPWDAGEGSDPSFRLAPRSRQRLRVARETGRLELKPFRAKGLKAGDERWVVTLDGGGMVLSDGPPIAATGFGPGLGPVSHLFERREDGWPLVDGDDQSTAAEGLYLAGPALRHAGNRFCFIYKFRQRYAHIADQIGRRLGRDTSGLQAWKDAGMWASDVSACGAQCEC